MKKYLNLFILYLKDLGCSNCESCGKKGVYFSHEEHFTPGSPDVYRCKYCKKYFI